MYRKNSEKVRRSMQEESGKPRKTEKGYLQTSKDAVRYKLLLDYGRGTYRHNTTKKVQLKILSKNRKIKMSSMEA